MAAGGCRYYSKYPYAVRHTVGFVFTANACPQPTCKNKSLCCAPATRTIVAFPSKHGQYKLQRKDHIDKLGAVVLVSFSALLGLNQVLIKVVNAGLQPVFQAGLRSVCAFLPILLFALLTRKVISVRDGSLLPGLLAGVLFALEFTLLFVALDYTSVARASVLFYTKPIWVAVAAHFLIPGETLTLKRIVGLLLACAGVVAALAHNANPVSDRAFIGDMLCLVASTLWACIALLARLTPLSKSTPEMQLLYQLGVSAPILLIASLAFGDWLREPTPIIWGIFAFQVLVVVCVGFLSWFWVLSIYPAADMAVYSFLAPVFGVLLGWLLLGESIGINVALALVLVSIGIALVNAPRRR